MGLTDAFNKIGRHSNHSNEEGGCSLCEIEQETLIEQVEI